MIKWFVGFGFALVTLGIVVFLAERYGYLQPVNTAVAVPHQPAAPVQQYPSATQSSSLPTCAQQPNDPNCNNIPPTWRLISK